MLIPLTVLCLLSEDFSGVPIFLEDGRWFIVSDDVIAVDPCNTFAFAFGVLPELRVSEPRERLSRTSGTRSESFNSTIVFVDFL